MKSYEVTVNVSDHNQADVVIGMIQHFFPNIQIKEKPAEKQEENKEEVVLEDYEWQIIELIRSIKENFKGFPPFTTGK